MCELFAMASRAPATINLSLEEFAKHGGLTNHHKDGWGIVYYHGRDVQIIREAEPAFNSPQMKFVQDQAHASNLVLSHIRKATLGDVSIRNTQPFGKELLGRVHTFAHNGMLHDITNLQPLTSSTFRPIGETDSEYAFCILMERMQTLWLSGTPPLSDRLSLVRRFANEIRTLGPANFIYSDAQYIYGHGDRRTHHDGMRPPGLYWLNRSCPKEPREIKSEGLSITTQAESQDISLLASVPLTNEKWEPLEQGEILVMGGGFVIARSSADD